MLAKKWWMWALVFFLALTALIFWGARPSHAITVVTHGGFQIYDIEYFPRSNRVYYWRCAWQDALGLVGFKKYRPPEDGPALVVYSSNPGLTSLLVLTIEGVPVRCSGEGFGNRLVSKFFFGPMTNGVYHLCPASWPGMNLGTNLADITVNFKN